MNFKLLSGLFLASVFASVNDKPVEKAAAAPVPTKTEPVGPTKTDANTAQPGVVPNPQGQAFADIVVTMRIGNVPVDLARTLLGAKKDAAVAPAAHPAGLAAPAHPERLAAPISPPAAGKQPKTVEAAIKKLTPPANGRKYDPFEDPNMKHMLFSAQMNRNNPFVTETIRVFDSRNRAETPELKQLREKWFNDRARLIAQFKEKSPKAAQKRKAGKPKHQATHRHLGPFIRTRQERPSIRKLPPNNVIS